MSATLLSSLMVDSATGIILPKKKFDLVTDEDTIQNISNVNIPDYFYNRYSFGVEVMDSLINGDGLMKTQVCTVSSPRGVGKTTLLMSMLHQLKNHNSHLKCIYLSNEECVQQLAFLAQRIGVDNIEVSNIKDIDKIVNIMHKYDVVAIDSLPGITHSSISAPKALESYITNSIVRTAKKTGCAVFLVMHFTKDGKEAGSKDVYHAVDTCITLNKLDVEDYGENCRLIEVTKSRFGSQAEVILRLTREGFDFTAPLEEKTSGNDCNKGQGVYINNKMRDNRAIMCRVKEKNSGGAKIQDFADLNIDMGRVERLLKELGNRGKVCKTGGGKGQSKDTIRWFLGDTEESDFGESEEV